MLQKHISDSNKEIINKMSLTNETRKVDISPIHTPCKNGNLEIVKFLIENGVDCSIKNGKGETPFHLACTSNTNSDVVKYLVKEPKITNIDLLTYDFQSPLHYASFNSQNASKIIFFLLENGSEINIRDKYGNTLLHYAVQSDNSYTYATCMLLEYVHYKEDLNVVNNNNETPLYLFISKQPNNIIPFTDKGPGMSSLHLACQIPKSPAIFLLLKLELLSMQKTIWEAPHSLSVIFQISNTFLRTKQTLKLKTWMVKTFSIS